MNKLNNIWFKLDLELKELKEVWFRWQKHELLFLRCKFGSAYFASWAKSSAVVILLLVEPDWLKWSKTMRRTVELNLQNCFPALKPWHNLSILGKGKIAPAVLLPHVPKHTLVSSLRSGKKESECKFRMNSGGRSWSHFLGTGARVKTSDSDHLCFGVCSLSLASVNARADGRCGRTRDKKIARSLCYRSTLTLRAWRLSTKPQLLLKLICAVELRRQLSTCPRTDLHDTGNIKASDVCWAPWTASAMRGCFPRPALIRVPLQEHVIDVFSSKARVPVYLHGFAFAEALQSCRSSSSTSLPDCREHSALQILL